MNLSRTHKYDDIIDLPHHVSASRPHMSMSDRAAQFSPFAALTGFEAAVRETARFTEGQVELEEEQIAELNRHLLYLAEHITEQPIITITYFEPDTKKAGGHYHTVTDIVTTIDSYHQFLTLQQGISLPFGSITKIEPSENIIKSMPDQD